MKLPTLLIIAAISLAACAATTQQSTFNTSAPIGEPEPVERPEVTPPPETTPKPASPPADAPGNRRGIDEMPRRAEEPPAEAPINRRGIDEMPGRRPAPMPPAPVGPQSISRLLEIDGQVLDYDRPLIAGAPGAAVSVALRGAERGESVGDEPITADEVNFQLDTSVTWRVTGGALTSTTDPEAVRWRLPDAAGECELSVEGHTQGSLGTGTSSRRHAVSFSERLGAQVLTPFDRSGPGAIRGYPIGVYPNEDAPNVPGPVARRPDAYRPPSHFWHVTEATRLARLSPHVRLGDLCSAPFVEGEAYIAVAPSLIERLEALHAACVARGYLDAEDASGLRVLRGYLSPSRLQQLRQAGTNISQFTRHLYGDAAIVIIDADEDEIMDDLNGDGQSDVADAALLAAEVEALEATLGRGGLGIFATRPPGDPELDDTPMVQFDCRGIRARWGQQPARP